MKTTSPFILSRGQGVRRNCMTGKLHNDPVTTGWRSQIIFTLIIIMMAALFFSRAALSVSIILFIVISFYHLTPSKQIRNFFSTPLLWGMSLLFFLPLISGIWSDDKKEWMEMIRIKLPLLFLPLAFAGPMWLSKKRWEYLSLIFVGIITLASIWSMFHYSSNMSEINDSYLRAKSIITPLENDHVRFSWLVSVAAILAGWIAVNKRKEKGAVSIVTAILFLWLVLFLHILAARTGLISFYMMMGGISCWLLFQKTKKKYGIVFLLIFLALPFIAYQVFPTFHNRVKYFRYDMEYFKKTNYLPGANDAVRVISLKAGWAVIHEHPAMGAGFGDIYSATKAWYDKNIPHMLEADKIYPSAEWMMYGAGCGWPGIILFIVVMIIPFGVKTNNKLLWWGVNATATFSLLFDIGLEVQFGVFIYSFVILWWWKWLSVEKM
ncbi:MAG: O-antigen ligase family protein [Chitinophagaceae bacterium]